MREGICYSGIPSADELCSCRGIPSRERMEAGPVAVVECIQCIPCNPCESACPFGAIKVGSPMTNAPVLDEAKCVGCGMCAKVCPYTAIISRKRPCENACKIKAISMNENKAAQIDNDKCIACGACVYRSPRRETRFRPSTAVAPWSARPASSA